MVSLFFFYRGSVSSEDVGSVRSGDASDNPRDDDSLSTVTGGSGTVELGRAGSRRPVYLTEDSDTIPTRDIGSEPLREHAVIWDCLLPLLV